MPIAKPKFDLSEEFRQLALELDLPQAELDEMSAEEARVKAEAGRSALFALKGLPKQPVWFERFEMLINGGWPWRQAAYIAWASMPKDNRWPKTQETLAKEILNLTSDRAINTWRRRNPAIDSMVAVLQSSELWEHRADAFKQLVDGMKRAGDDYKFAKHLELFFRMTGDDVPTSQLVALIKRKGASGPQEIDEATLDELAAGAKELQDGVAGEEMDEDAAE
jgi:hypothetical protein